MESREHQSSLAGYPCIPTGAALMFPESLPVGFQNPKFGIGGKPLCTKSCLKRCLKKELKNGIYFA
jgi:hypothetical protein